MQDKSYSASTIKTDLAAIRFWHDQIPNAKYSLPSNDEFVLERRKFGNVDRTWSTSEFNLMIAECWKYKRDDYAACIVIARYAGLRLHEVLRIDTSIARNALKDGFITIKGADGSPITPNYLTRTFHKLIVKSDLPNIRLHDLRHSTASNLLSHGFSVVEVQHWLGQSQASTTLNFYSHIDASSKIGIKNELEKLLSLEKC